MKRNPVVPISDAVNGWLARRPYLREGLMEQRLIEVFSESITPVKRYVTSVKCCGHSLVSCLINGSFCSFGRFLWASLR